MAQYRRKRKKAFHIDRRTAAFLNIFHVYVKQEGKTLHRFDVRASNAEHAEEIAKSSAIVMPDDVEYIVERSPDKVSSPRGIIGR